MTTANFWNERYKSGGNSGTGSYGRAADWKAEYVNNVLLEYNVRSILDFGCGDGNQLSLLNLNGIQYTGLDVSTHILEQNTRKFPQHTFKTFDPALKDRADLCLSMEVIFHLMTDEEYNSYMFKLQEAADKLILIFSSYDENGPKFPHVRHHDFRKDIGANFKLINQKPYPFP